ncbi:xylose ABC transporter membrane protein [Halanaerobium saccharolyticum]|uniref:Xylose transport system permease protein XylH n=1 Tax=Halanaerobium saccharolyticum TaxID=43595 RepID=A0A4R7YW58_9FIRM|nr:sugar ABC transporter permease [Halanaerobium saccharolyticum]RAK07187.1 xylose ABC transporter membrane protein [Halanaerobium saccharolyticum]TDW02100.1 xylose ABC transporter membrane protein [Halanaerobium saccharolyticum]TDX58831.1 xylose ABC transporter membrane protein [Halanaerobium saccharolyticum]
MAEKSKLKIDFRTYMMIVALVSIWIIFSFTTGGSFLSARNISNLFRQSVFTSVLAIGMVLVIIMGHIDLSVGSLVGLAGGVIAILDVWQGMNPVFSIGLTLLLGLILGLWNGWWVAYQKVPSFIVTLGGLLIFRGVLVGITRGTTIGPMSDIFYYLGKGYLADTTGVIFAVLAGLAVIFVQWKSRQDKLKYDFDVLPLKLEIAKISLSVILLVVFILVLNSYRGIPVPLMILTIFLAIFSFITSKTVFGRHIYAIGGNADAAKLSGIDLKKITLVVFMINGLMASIGGILLTSRLNAASVAAGDGAELDAIAACVIGGASLAGGIGKVGGAVVGAIVMASLDNGMSLMNVQNFWQSIIKGLILILAVWVDMYTKNKNAAA